MTRAMSALAPRLARFAVLAGIVAAAWFLFPAAGYA